MPVARIVRRYGLWLIRAPLTQSSVKARSVIKSFKINDLIFIWWATFPLGIAWAFTTKKTMSQKKWQRRTAIIVAAKYRRERIEMPRFFLRSLFFRG